MVATLPGNLEKPGIWHFRQNKSGKTWNLRNFKQSLEFLTTFTF